MKTLTVYQPYATLKVKNLKLYETRSWQTPYRGPLAIHAGKRHPSTVLDTLPGNTAREMRQLLKGVLLESLPTGCVIGTGILVACHLIDEVFLAGLGPVQLLLGDYTLGRYAWEFKDMSELLIPVPAKGKQGLWEWSGKHHNIEVSK